MHLFYTHIPKDFDATESLLKLPLALQKRLKQCPGKQARNRSFTAKILLAEVLAGKSGMSKVALLNRLVYDMLGKPELKGIPMFFSLSHAGNQVVCLTNEMDAVGVDIERNTHQINSSTAFFLSKIEQQKLSAENLGNTYLLKKWVQKEAVSKAIGKGLSLGFHTIESSGTYCFWRNEKFMTHEVNVHPDYYCYVAGKTGKTKPEVSEISFEKLLNNLI